MWNDIQEKSARMLDFPAIAGWVADCAASEEGRVKLLSETPRCDAHEFEELKGRVQSTLNLFKKNEERFRGSFPSIAHWIGLLGKRGARLGLEELFALGTWLNGLFSMARFFLHGSDDALRSMAEEAIQCASVRSVIWGVLDSEGNLKDLPGIREARKALHSAQKDRDSTVNSLSGELTSRNLLHNNIPALRDGRLVFVVKTGIRKRIDGLVHEYSASKESVYMEPSPLVQKNNAVAHCTARLEEEYIKILRETSAALHERYAEIKRAQELLAWLDSIYARARFVTGHKWILPLDGKTLSLCNAIHPEIEKAHPISLILEPAIKTVVVTGPNTGGKTASLKTIGLLALCNQFGIGIPADESSSMPCYDAILADIGDEQSILQSLSTFSGHIRNVASILSATTQRSLVLLDEPGSGTDPQEGCALAMSILDTLQGKNCLTLVATHHELLKNYACITPGCINAAMEFDIEDLLPRYRLKLGLAGASHALEIAARQGLGDDVIRGASRYLGEKRIELSEMLAKLAHTQKELEREQSEQRILRLSMQEELEKTKSSRIRLLEQEKDLRKNGLAELKKLLTSSSRELERLVRELKESGADSLAIRNVKEYSGHLRSTIAQETEIVDHLEEEIEQSENPHEDGELVLAENQEVELKSIRSKARLIRKVKEGEWQVNVGSMRMIVKETEMRALKQPASAHAPGKWRMSAPLVSVELSGDGSGHKRKALIEIDVRGCRVVEALAKIDSQIDAALVQGLQSFSILHGTGEGLLSAGIHEHLAKQSYVSSFAFGHPDEGGHGRTVVTLASASK